MWSSFRNLVHDVLSTLAKVYAIEAPDIFRHIRERVGP
jgi:hypothetical protein